MSRYPEPERKVGPIETAFWSAIAIAAVCIFVGFGSAGVYAAWQWALVPPTIKCENSWGDRSTDPRCQK